MRVAKWGNSLAVRIPGAVVRMLNLREGDDIEIDIHPKTGTESRLAELRQFRGILPLGYRFDREDAHER
ncbi:MAG: AbrB/MazE/SpoVT family DNA-binding domain-containing protein [Candidatus Accumulibacter sp.]|nr:AbrB/MazE/SpoVT family DNA-binding domain-containing protein [Accumulibacter sp.]